MMNRHDYTRFQDPCIKYPIDDLELPFDSYIATCQQIIQQNRVDLTNNKESERIISANSPFELQPEATTKSGALLIHGLFDCPFIMRDIGTQLQSEGLLVRSILLPGHGTVPGGLLHVTYQDWIQAVHYGIHSLSKEVDKIFLVGFSTGASLALYHALQNTFPNIAGLILLAPAIQISPLGCMANLPSKLSRFSDRFNWLHQVTEDDYTRYQSVTFNSAYQVYLLTQEIKKLSDNHFLRHPIFVSISADDKTVSSKATLQHFRQHTLKESRLLVYTNQPDSFHDTRIIKRPAAYPELNIQNISHVAIPNAPSNPHYGKQGDYEFASHVDDNLQTGSKNIYGTLNNTVYDLMNMLYRAGLTNHQYLRLTFNPDFDFLAQSIRQFIKKILYP